MPAVFEAKWDGGDCANCDTPIRKGDELTWLKRTGDIDRPIHVRCPDEVAGVAPAAPLCGSCFCYHNGEWPVSEPARDEQPGVRAFNAARLKRRGLAARPGFAANETQ